MPVYVNEWQNKVKQDSCTDKTVQRQDAGICKWMAKCFVSTTVLLYFILPFIYIYRHPVSWVFCQYNCLALLYFAIHLHIQASCLLTVLSVQLSCFTLFCHSFTYTGILSLDCFVSTTVLLYPILPFIYIYRHPFSVPFCQYNCLALLYFAQNKVRQDSCTDKTVQRKDVGICKWMAK
jgi:hypothetical protein